MAILERNAKKKRMRTSKKKHNPSNNHYNFNLSFNDSSCFFEVLQYYFDVLWFIFERELFLEEGKLCMYSKNEIDVNRYLAQIPNFTHRNKFLRDWYCNNPNISVYLYNRNELIYRGYANSAYN